MLSPKTTPRLVGPIFHTLVRAKYIYGLIHIPISQTLLDLDNGMLATLFRRFSVSGPNQAVPKFTYCVPSSVFVPSSQCERTLYINISGSSKRAKIFPSSKQTPSSTKASPKLPHAANTTPFHRAFVNKLSTKETRRRSFVIWNSARRGPRQPPPITPKGWPIALRLSNRNYVQRLLAVRWYLGTFPIPIPGNLIPLHLRSQLKTLMRLDSTHITKRDIQDLHRTITAIQNDPQ